MLQPTVYPQHLACNGRLKEPLISFRGSDSLFVGYRLGSVDEDGKLKTEMIRLPDWSCNWDKHSTPVDVKFRTNGRITDGCLSITVEDVRYENFATVVHDPLCGSPIENFSHCEVRVVLPGSTVLDEPPPNAKKKDSAASKDARHRWRRHIRNRLKVVIIAQA